MVRRVTCLTVGVLLFALRPALGDLGPFGPLPEPHYLLEADKTTYNVGETVGIVFHIRNEGDGDLVYTFNCSPGLYVETFREQELVWSSRILCMPVMQDITIGPGEFLGVSAIWDQMDRFGESVEPGYYELRGVIDGQSASVGVDYPELPVTQIQIVPEPSSIALLLFASAIIPLRRLRNG